MNETKHTPTPWSKAKFSNIHEQGLVSADHDGCNVAVTYQGQADAEFIVTACNSHDALVAQLAELVREADREGGSVRKVSRYEIDKARALLSQLEAGK